MTKSQLKDAKIRYISKIYSNFSPETIISRKIFLSEIEKAFIAGYKAEWEYDYNCSVKSRYRQTKGK